MFDIHIRKDLSMPIGKVAAQAAHAIGGILLDRCALVSETDDAVTLKIEEGSRNLLKLLSDTSEINLYWDTDSEFNALDGKGCAIIDNGLTCFDGVPTPTTIGISSVGEIIDESMRLQYDVSTIDYKQGFFVDRSKNLDSEEIIKSVAALSLNSIVEVFDTETLTMTLDKKSAMYKWLTSSFGKTVVGTKKATKFKLIKETLCSEDVVEIKNIEAVFATNPLSSDILTKFTRSSTFRLLD